MGIRCISGNVAPMIHSARDFIDVSGNTVDTHHMNSPLLLGIKPIIAGNKQVMTTLMA